MPENRLIEHFALSDEPTPIKIGETPYVVSDEELAEEQLGRDANDASHRCAEGLANWDSMTSSAQKALLKDVLVVIKLLATREGLL